ncbi:hypothetical protein ONZ45_g8543 [Pleurotus djamor]|nr:hypothetical protein ONZ45_g8543 [Pleurotus djamor]
MPMLPRLTFLQLTSQGLAVSSVLRAFACMPAVQDVVIENLFNDNEAAPTLPVVLRALICLSINFLDSPSSRIFASLDLPHSAYIQVCFACLVGQASEIPDISALAVRFHEFIGPKNINARNITLGIDCTTFELWIPSAEDSGGLALNGNFTRPDAVLPLFNALTETFTSLTYDIIPNTNFGNMLFLRLEHLKHLKLSTNSPRNDTMILTLLLKAPRDTFPLLPNLESLSGDFHTQDHVEALEILLQDRRELGIPIQTISTSKIHEGVVSHLKEEYGVILDFT